MTKYSRYNIVYHLQKWMDSVAGQTFLNYAYSWGASIVILGTLFKLTHLPAANFFLFLGMGTEVFVFFISAFDRPFDKTADGRTLSRTGDMGTNGNQNGASHDVFSEDSDLQGKKEELLETYDEQIEQMRECNERLTEVSAMTESVAREMGAFSRIYATIRNSVTRELKEDRMI